MIKFRCPVYMDKKEKTEKENKPGKVKATLKKVGTVLGAGLIVTGAALTGKELATKKESSDPEPATEENTTGE